MFLEKYGYKQWQIWNTCFAMTFFYDTLWSEMQFVL